MRRTSCPFGFAVLAGILCLSIPAVPGQASALPALPSAQITHTPPKGFSPGEILTLTVLVSGEADWVRLFYRVEGAAAFQVRNMDKTGPGSFRFQFDTSQLVTPKFDYYLSVRLGEETVFFPAQGADRPESVAGTAPAPPPSGFRLPFSVRVDGSILDRAGPSAAGDGPPDVTGDGNILLSRNTRGRDLEVLTEANFAYSNHPLAGGPDIALSNLAVSLRTPHHEFRGGDIVINHSTLTITGLGRRGAAYQYETEGFSVQVFDIASQQSTGWGGLLPRSEANLYGGAARASLWGGRLGFKVVYVAGRDDPNLAAGVAGDSLRRRKGTVLSFIPELQLFNRALRLRGEYALSSCDQDLQDEAGIDKDTAWQAEGSLTLGRISLSGRYKHIGGRYASIGQPYFINDRRGFDLSLVVPGDRVQLAANILQESDNVGRNPARSMSLDLNGGALLSWRAWSWLTLTAGYRRDAQRIYDGPDRETLQDELSTENIFLGLNLSAGSAFTIMCQGAWTRLRSDFDPLRNQEALVLNLGGMFRRGPLLALAANFGFSVFGRSLSRRDVQNLNAYLSGEWSILPGALSLTAMGTFSRTRTGPENIDNLNATALVNFHLRTISRRLGSAVIAAGGEVRRMRSAYYSDRSEWLKLQMHFSF